MKKWIDLSYDVGEIVILKTDKDQSKRIVKSVWLMQTGIQYELSLGNSNSWHYDFEISKEPDLVAKFESQNLES